LRAWALPWRAYSGDSVGHAGENLGDVAYFDLPGLAVEFPRHVEQTAEISGQYRFGASRGNIGHHLVGNFPVFDTATCNKRSALRKRPGDYGCARKPRMDQEQTIDILQFRVWKIRR
jgi:hypothetical protein